MHEILEGKNPAVNIEIKPHDTISVSEATSNMIYVVGDVEHGGAFTLGGRQTLSVLRSLSLAGGLGRTAKPQKARIIRSVPGELKPQEIAVNIKQYLTERQKISCCCPKMSSSFLPAAVKFLPPTLFPRLYPPPLTLRSTVNEDSMENRPLLEGPAPDPQRRKNGENHLLARQQYIEVPSSRVIEEPGPGLLLEYWDILRRHSGTLILIAFLGFLTSILLTLPQTPIYQARASLEIQSLNENFLNMREMSPTANGGGLYPPQSDLQTQAKILQSESVLERVIAKLNLEPKLLQEKDRGRLAAWRNALGLPESSSDSPREEVLRLVTRT